MEKRLSLKWATKKLLSNIMLQNELESEVVSEATKRFNSLVYRRKQNEKLTICQNGESVNAATAVFRLNIMSFSPKKRSY